MLISLSRCNWLGGEAVSLAINYSYSAEFADARYEKLLVDGVTYGQVRQYGNLTFIKVDGAGHSVLQPALESRACES